MKYYNIYTRLVFVLYIISVPFSVLANEDGKPFSVSGEQLDYIIPTGWKLAWMSGNADGNYLAEYVPENEDINSWRVAYLSIERFSYPSKETLKKLEDQMTRISDYGLILFIREAAKSCGGEHTPMSQRVNTYNGIHFAVGGGFCEKYGSDAPFGEGAFVAYAEGKQFVHRIKYAWRPRNTEEQKLNTPWRITPEKAKEYLESIKAMTLCGGDKQPICKVTYTR